MEDRVGESVVRLKQGDITEEEVDAIVNAANTSLLGGGGVDGVIHRAGGTRILEECKKLGGCKTGDAKITDGGDLPASHVIHTVGPIWRGGSGNEDSRLESAYRRSLEVALENGLSSVAFPSISTGAYGFPIERAACIALRTIAGFIKEHPAIKEVNMVLFGKRDLEVYEKAWEEVKADVG